MKMELLIIYLVGAICTSWGLSVPSMSREQRPFLSISSVVWPFTVTVFGLFVLFALLAHWYDAMALNLAGRRTDFHKNPAAAVAPDSGNDSQAGI